MRGKIDFFKTKHMFKPGPGVRTHQTIQIQVCELFQSSLSGSASFPVSSFFPEVPWLLPFAKCHHTNKDSYNFSRN